MPGQGNSNGGVGNESADNAVMVSIGDLMIALPEGLHPFVRLVLSDAGVQARLGAEIEADAFVAAARSVAAEYAVALDTELLAATLRPDPIGLGRFESAPIECDGWPPEGWIPAQVVHADDPPRFDWLWFGDRNLSGSFFEDDVRRASALPLNWLLRIRTGLPALVAGAETASAAPLAGIVYHMSRCGSTLLAQMLATVPGHVVLSEPTPLDELLLWIWRTGVSPKEAAPTLRAAVAALGRQRGCWPNNVAERLFIKADAWHTLLIPHIHAAFPDVPWLYLFREPVEVLASHRRMPGIQTVAGIMPEALFGISEATAMAPLDYTVQVFDAIGQAAIAYRRLGSALFIEYPDLVQVAPTRIAEHFGLELSARECAKMSSRARHDAKAPDLEFAADGERKRNESATPIREASEKLAKTHLRLLALIE